MSSAMYRLQNSACFLPPKTVPELMGQFEAEFANGTIRLKNKKGGFLKTRPLNISQPIQITKIIRLVTPDSSLQYFQEG